jgi:hypothetical protein
VHFTTWVVVVALLALFALLHRFGQVLPLQIAPAFIMLAVLLLFALRYLVSRLKRRVESTGCTMLLASKTLRRLDLKESSHSTGAMSTSTGAWSQQSKSTSTGAWSQQSMSTASSPAIEDLENPSHASEDLENPSQSSTDQSVIAVASVVRLAESLHARTSTELWVSRILQVTLFVLSYSCARTIGDPNEWRTQPREVVYVCGFFMLLFLLLAHLLSKTFPVFAALMALPPYTDRGNIEMLFRVLDEFSHPAVIDQGAQCCLAPAPAAPSPRRPGRRGRTWSVAEKGVGCSDAIPSPSTPCVIPSVQSVIPDEPESESVPAPPKHAFKLTPSPPDVTSAPSVLVVESAESESTPSVYAAQAEFQGP